MASELQMLASRLNTRITFIRNHKVRQPNGSFLDGWQDYKTTFAEVMAIVGEEVEMAAAQNSEVGYRITIRYRRDIDEGMRIRLRDGRVVGISDIRDPYATRVLLEVRAIWKQGGV
jgi:SPP1 family predicted phage head-tail adaptor